MSRLRWMTMVAALCVMAGTAEANYRARVLVPAGPFHGVHGLAFGPDGLLYAGDIMGASVHRVDVTSGRHRVAVGPPEGMADDVAFAPAGTPFAGTMVWTGVSVGRLYARAPGGAPRLIADNLPSVNSVGFAPDGRLFVTQTGPEHKALWQADLSGRTPPRKLWDNTGGLNGFVIAADGYLYGPQADLGRVIRLNLETLEVKVIAESFDWPTAVEMDERGSLYVLDFNAGTVTRVNKDTGDKVLLATLAPGLDNMAMGPPGSAFAGKLYVSSIGGNAIYEIDLATAAQRTVAAGRLTAPGGVAVLGQDDGARVYVADMFTLRRIDPATGAVTDVMPVTGTGAYPATVTAGKLNGRAVLATASWFTGRVQILDPQTGATWREEAGLAAPHGLAILPDGALLVAEAGAGKITRIAPDGARSVLVEGFRYPVGLALARDGATVFVSDAEAGAVAAVDATSGARRDVALRLKQPEGLALLPDGRLAVVEVGAKAVRALDPATGTVTDIVTRADVGLTPPEPLPKTWIFNGIAVGPDGALYLPSDMQAGLFVLKPADGPTSTLDALRRLTSGWFR